MAYFDPYLDNVALQNLSTIVSLTSGAILAKDIRFISSVKVVKNQRPRLTRIFADSWFKEHSLEEGKIRVEQSGKEHRRFILLHDDRVLIIPFSLNRLNVNETAHIEVDSNDKSFFEEQWKISLPLE